MNSQLSTIISTAIIASTGTLFLVFLWNQIIRKINRRIHINKKVIRDSFDTVWKWFSDVRNYEKLYPNWVDSVEQVKNDTYRILDKFGETYDAMTDLDKKRGVIDVHIQGEVSRTRLVALSDTETLVLHIGEREGFSLFAWLYLKKTINADFKNAKAVIEGWS